MIEAKNVERHRGCDPFEEEMKQLTVTLRQQTAAAGRLGAAIAANLKELGYGE